MVANNGREDMPAKNLPAGLGFLKPVEMLVGQIKGTLAVERAHGMRYTVRVSRRGCRLKNKTRGDDRGFSKGCGRSRLRSGLLDETGLDGLDRDKHALGAAIGHF